MTGRTDLSFFKNGPDSTLHWFKVQKNKHFPKTLLWEKVPRLLNPFKRKYLSPFHPPRIQRSLQPWSRETRLLLELLADKSIIHKVLVFTTTSDMGSRWFYLDFKGRLERTAHLSLKWQCMKLWEWSQMSSEDPGRDVRNMDYSLRKVQTLNRVSSWQLPCGCKG